MASNREKMLNGIRKDIEYYKSYKFGLYAFVMENYASLKHGDKIPPEKIVMIFKEITAMDRKIDILYKIIRSHDP